MPAKTVGGRAHRSDFKQPLETNTAKEQPNPNMTKPSDDQKILMTKKFENPTIVNITNKFGFGLQLPYGESIQEVTADLDDQKF